MADNTDIATGVAAAIRTWSSKDLGSNVHVHRALAASLSAGGVLLDASPTNPIPVGLAKPAGDNLALASSLPAVSQLYDDAALTTKAQRNAKSATDTATGDAFPAAGQMAWNGTTWSRIRAPYQETVLASAARTTNGSTPTLRNYGFRGALVRLNVTAIPSPPTTGLSISFLAGGNMYPFDVAKTTTNAIKAVGTFYLLMYPGLSWAPQGATTLTPPAPGAAGATGVGVPLPDSFTLRCTHGTVGESYTYSIDISYLL